MPDDKDGSDLSDLKSRLGLNKDEETPEDEEQDSESAQDDDGTMKMEGGAGPNQDSGSPGGSSSEEPKTAELSGSRSRPSNGPPSPSGPGPASSGPPGGSQGQSGGPQGPPGQAPKGVPADQPDDDAVELTEPASESASTPSGDGLSLDDDFDVGEDDSTFSAAVLALMAVILVVGAAFGYFAAESLRNRALYQARTTDAQEILNAARPKVETFRSVFETLQGMSPKKVQYEEVRSLAEKEFALPTGALPNNNLLLGRDLMDLMLSYMVDARRLESLLEQHHRLTNKTERERLEELVGEEGESSANEETYGIVFDYGTLVRNVQNADYVPKVGRLARLEGLTGEASGDDSGDDSQGGEEDQLPKGMVRYELLNGTESGKLPVQSVIPINRGQMRSAVSGMNAFERYRQRMGEIVRLAKKIDGYAGEFLNQFESVANRPAPSLLQLSGPSRETSNSESKAKRGTASGGNQPGAPSGDEQTGE